MEPAARACLRDRVVALLHDPVDRKLACWIFGTDDAEAIALRVERYCRDQLGSGVAWCDEFIQSVGAVFVVGLDSQERVTLKAHAVDKSRLGAAGTLPSLTAVYGVQGSSPPAGSPARP